MLYLCITIQNEDFVFETLPLGKVDLFPSACEVVIGIVGLVY
jgi:hypothetical protein